MDDKYDFRKKLRKEGIRARAGISPQKRRERSARIVELIKESELFRQAKTVMIYKAVGAEVDLSLLEGGQKMLVYPVCAGDGIMDAFYVNENGGWRQGMYGILEPVPEKSALADPGRIDLALCPCTGFDADFNRLGMGKGYYDRFLLKCVNADIGAVAFEAQRMDKIPAGSWDVPMDFIITETGINYRK